MNIVTMLVLDSDSMQPLRPQRAPVAGDNIIRFLPNGGTSKEIYQLPIEVIQPQPLMKIVVNDPAVTGVITKGRIHIIPLNEKFTITAKVALPDEENLILIFERVIKGGQEVVGDVRSVANISAGVLTTTGSFDIKGNYVLTQRRTNEAFVNIGVPVEFVFNTIEFNVV